MGKGIGAITGGIAKAAGIKSGVERGKEGYSEYINSVQRGEKKAYNFLNPYTDVGQGALSPLSTLLTGQSYDPETGEFTQVSPEDRYASFEQSPGYQFRMDEGLRALDNSQSVRGNMFSGGASKELTKYSQGVASNEYGNYLSSLQQLAGMGQASAGQSANIATGTAGQIGQAQIGAGNVAMQGRMARGQNQADTFGAVGGAADTAAGPGGLMALFSDKTLKENIEQVGESESGIPIYHFDYKNKIYGQFRYEGVMAQDLLKSNPDAIINHGDILKVDYSKIDVNFKRI